MALAAFFELGVEEFRLVAVEDFGNQRLVQLGPELLVAGQKARVEDRGLFLQVVGRHLDAFADVAYRVADHQSRVPQRVQNSLGDDFQVRPRLPVMQEQQIDVRIDGLSSPRP